MVCKSNVTCFTAYATLTFNKGSQYAQVTIPAHWVECNSVIGVFIDDTSPRIIEALQAGLQMNAINRVDGESFDVVGVVNDKKFVGDIAIACLAT